jgi:hypothetical protein
MPNKRPRPYPSKIRLMHPQATKYNILFAASAMLKHSNFRL